MESTQNVVFLIQKIWIDFTENEIGSAVGYTPYGFVYTEDQAKQLCEKSRIYTKEDCWAIWREMPEYKYTEIKRI